MSDEEHAETSASADIVWGMDAIAAEINRTAAQAYYLFANGKLPGVKKLGHRTFVGSRKELRRFVELAESYQPTEATD